MNAMMEESVELVRSAPLAALVDRLVARRRRELNAGDFGLSKNQSAAAERVVCGWAGLTRDRLGSWRSPHAVIELSQADAVLTRLELCWWEAYDPNAAPSLYSPAEWIDVVDEASRAFEGEELLGGEHDLTRSERDWHQDRRRARSDGVSGQGLQSASAQLPRSEVEVPDSRQGGTAAQPSLLRAANAGRQVRPTIVGEAPGRKPGAPLVGTCGRRLAEWAGLEGVRELSTLFELTNLMRTWPGAQGKGSAWPKDEARRAARRHPLRGVCVLLGLRVAAAYDLDDLGYATWLRGRRYAACVVPHPSGINRLYNEAEWRERTGAVLEEALRW